MIHRFKPKGFVIIKRWYQMNTGEVLKLLRLSRSTVYRWLAEGLIRPKTMGNSYDYGDNDVKQSLTVAKEESPLL